MVCRVIVIPTDQDFALIIYNSNTISLLPPPALVAPGTTTAPGSSVGTVTPTFQWQPVTGADGYGLYISRFNGSTYDLIFNSETDVGGTLVGTSYFLPSGRLQDGNQYRWNMSSHNSAGYGSPNVSRYYFSVSLPVQNYTITVSASPSAGGTVSGGGTFAAGSSRTVTATANTNYTFTNWTENGSVVSSSASYTFTLNSNRNLVANFTAVNYTITVSASPSAGGTVSGGGTFAGGQFAHGDGHGQQRLHLCQLDGEWKCGQFVGKLYLFTLNSNRNLVANFTANAVNYTITVSASPSAGGTVSGGGTFAAGSSRTVTATANSGYTFANWTENGSVVSSSASYTFTLNSNRNLVANFTAVNYTITVSASPSAGGTVSGGGTFAAGSSRTVTATANSGYTFANWTENGSVVSSSASYTFTLNGNRTLVANFTPGELHDHGERIAECWRHGQWRWNIRGGQFAHGDGDGQQRLHLCQLDRERQRGELIGELHFHTQWQSQSGC